MAFSLFGLCRPFGLIVGFDFFEQTAFVVVDRLFNFKEVGFVSFCRRFPADLFEELGFIFGQGADVDAFSRGFFLNRLHVVDIFCFRRFGRGARVAQHVEHVVFFFSLAAADRLGLGFRVAGRFGRLRFASCGLLHELGSRLAPLLHFFRGIWRNPRNVFAQFDVFLRLRAVRFVADHKTFGVFVCFVFVDRFFGFEQGVVFSFFRFEEIVCVPFVPDRRRLRLAVFCIIVVHRKECLDVVVCRGCIDFVFCQGRFGFRLHGNAGIRGGIRCRFGLRRFNLVLVIGQLLFGAVGRSQGVVTFGADIRHFGVAFDEGLSELGKLVVVVRSVLASGFDLAAQRFFFGFLGFNLRCNFRFFALGVGDKIVLLGELRLEIFDVGCGLRLLILQSCFRVGLFALRAGDLSVSFSADLGFKGLFFVCQCLAFRLDLRCDRFVDQLTDRFLTVGNGIVKGRINGSPLFRHRARVRKGHVRRLEIGVAGRLNRAFRFWAGWRGHFAAFLLGEHRLEVLGFFYDFRHFIVAIILIIHGSTHFLFRLFHDRKR